MLEKHNISIHIVMQVRMYCKEIKKKRKGLMKEIDYGSVGMRIRQLRKTKGWSQDVLAGKCGISMSFLGHIERGSRIMSMETFVNICDALGVGADELLWGVSVPSNAMLDMWNLLDKNRNKKSDEKVAMAGKDTEKDKDSGVKAKRNDSYAMYVKIMKSVAEILNEPME